MNFQRMMITLNTGQLQASVVSLTESKWKLPLGLISTAAHLSFETLASNGCRHFQDPACIRLTDQSHRKTHYWLEDPIYF